MGCCHRQVGLESIPPNGSWHPVMTPWNREVGEGFLVKRHFLRRDPALSFSSVAAAVLSSYEPQDCLLVVTPRRPIVLPDGIYSSQRRELRYREVYSLDPRRPIR